MVVVLALFPPRTDVSLIASRIHLSPDGLRVIAGVQT